MEICLQFNWNDEKADRIESKSEMQILDDIQNDRYTPLTGDEKENIESLLRSSAKTQPKNFKKEKVSH